METHILKVGMQCIIYRCILYTLQMKQEAFYDTGKVGIFVFKKV